MTRRKPFPIRRRVFRHGRAAAAATSDTRQTARSPEADGIGNGQAEAVVSENARRGRRRPRQAPPRLPDSGCRHPDGTSVPATPICADFPHGKRSVAAGERRHRADGTRPPTPEISIMGYAGDTEYAAGSIPHIAHQTLRPARPSGSGAHRSSTNLMQPSGYRTPQLESHINTDENTTKPVMGNAGIGGGFEGFRKERPQPADGPDAQDRAV